MVQNVKLPALNHGVCIKFHFLYHLACFQLNYANRHINCLDSSIYVGTSQGEIIHYFRDESAVSTRQRPYKF